MRPRDWLGTAAVLVLAPEGLAAQTQRLTAGELIELCGLYQQQEQSDEPSLCAAYVRGFLDGTIAAGGRVIPAAAQIASDESWTDRAARTRLGSSRLPVLAYCLDEATPLDEVIARVLTHAHERPMSADTPAGDLMTAALQRFYRCRPRE